MCYALSFSLLAKYMSYSNQLYTSLAYFTIIAFSLPSCFLLDIDECRLGIDDCEQLCQDTDGSYICDCSLGYNLNVDGRTCTGMWYTAIHNN